MLQFNRQAVRRHWARWVAASLLGVVLVRIGWEPFTRRLKEGCREMYLQVTLRPKIERELGFRFETPYMKEYDSLLSTEVISFTIFKTNGVLWQAGLRDGDVLLDPRRSIAAICSEWDAARGREVSFHVVSFGTGPALEKRPRRTIAFVMPEKQAKAGNASGKQGPIAIP